MSAHPDTRKMTLAEYLAFERASEEKHEHVNGVVYAMSGGTPEHSALAAALLVALGSALAGKPCRVFTSDARLRVEGTGASTYPDASVVCGPRPPTRTPSPTPSSWWRSSRRRARPMTGARRPTTTGSSLR
jgi:Uma2 family endonuclease